MLSYILESEKMNIKQYVKKPIIIHALEYTGDNLDDVYKFVGDKAYTSNGNLFIKTLEGDHRASIGDYIIKGIKGEFYPCKPDIFRMTYDEA